MANIDDTRDIAVESRSNISAHIADCAAVRQRNEKKLDKIDEKLDKILWIVLPILGGIILASHIADWLFHR
jgi:hypothetical protein